MPTTLDISGRFSEATSMEFTTTNCEEHTMTDRIQAIYADLKFADRMTPGRTPWQTLLRRAEEIAAREEIINSHPVFASFSPEARETIARNAS